MRQRRRQVGVIGEADVKLNLETLSPVAVWSPEISKLSGTVIDEDMPEILTICGPLSVASAESVMLVELSTASIVVPNAIRHRSLAPNQQPRRAGDARDHLRSTV